MKKALSIFLFFCFCFNTDVIAQKKQKNTWIKEQDSKSDYQYKTHFYLALKEKSLENFDINSLPINPDAPVIKIFNICQIIIQYLPKQLQCPA